MNNLSLPFTPLKLKETINDIIAELKKRYVFETSFLMTVYNNYSQGSNISSILNSNKFNALYAAVNSGFEISATGGNKYFKILYADTEEVASDNYRAVKIVFVNDSKLVKFVFSKFDTSVYLDTKTITTI